MASAGYCIYCVCTSKCGPSAHFYDCFKFWCLSNNIKITIKKMFLYYHFWVLLLTCIVISSRHEVTTVVGRDGYSIFVFGGPMPLQTEDASAFCLPVSPVKSFTAMSPAHACSVSVIRTSQAVSMAVSSSCMSAWSFRPPDSRHVLQETQPKFLIHLSPHDHAWILTAEPFLPCPLKPSLF